MKVMIVLAIVVLQRYGLRCSRFFLRHLIKCEEVAFYGRGVATQPQLDLESRSTTNLVPNWDHASIFGLPSYSQLFPTAIMSDSPPDRIHFNSTMVILNSTSSPISLSRRQYEGRSMEAFIEKECRMIMHEDKSLDEFTA
ncbi:predicted protein [Lichtheimia corymbifera JMRC:FSU:9682]|uniref:Uncharacterized protein n=1 Tax=Lichtheimia corymbifera JMRC:FSU:9682 TaxID=1263082 RepID=A0A068S6E6_9FUNG|nr:predicted protein [Lichtheimia corymbifera JMRC:FSU:9682]